MRRLTLRIPFLFASAILLGCTTLQMLVSPPTPTPTCTITPTITPTITLTPTDTASPFPTAEDLIGTHWRIVYDAPRSGHMEYELSFLANGVLRNTHPNDKTYDNDTWEMIGSQIVIKFNDGYAVYTGDFIDSDTISGTATNKVHEEWEWTAYRLED
jgi:hypothetical protein